VILTNQTITIEAQLPPVAHRCVAQLAASGVDHRDAIQALDAFGGPVQAEIVPHGFQNR